MLTDIIAEGDFEIKEEELWYDHRDLENDLHLAAELGKTLLERNHELEEGLQQMYTTNHEQQQEIEHLSKQVEMLRSVNDQHAKVYEQLDATARDLERSNQRLALENRSAQLKIEGFLPSEHSLSASTPSLEEDEWEAKEHAVLLHSLQAQLNVERTLRETAEQEAEALAREISDLEPCMTLLEGYKSRLAETEAEVEELRQMLHSDSASHMLPGSLFFPSEEDVSETWEMRQVLKVCNSERQLLGVSSKDDDLRDEEHVHRGHLETVQNHGMSLLNEMDAQYNALQWKYNALLRHCEAGSQLQCDKAVQTDDIQPSTLNPVKHTSSQESAQIPEYKTLFNEIFTYIQNSKKDLEINRNKSN
ncbi:cerebellar degeneration-related protein 2 [Clarias gariepinus]|uniref:cerebellar degeneration-related protein 2 n=1 Tax=Clarias gariepinus TaxID=13013 RepID=UPI00234C489E|nr:cerebellar degeneration-related protein 2 [Clarias gariepinus]